MRHIEINLSVILHKVKLQVKFPSSLVASLKAQNLQSSFGPEVAFKLGEAYPQATANLKFTVLADSNRNIFTQKKISINVFLNTSSGRIPAGAAYIAFNLIKKANNREIINIQKCPDKSAFIEATISYQILNQTASLSMNELSNFRKNRQQSPSDDLFTLRQNNMVQQLKASKTSKPKIADGGIKFSKESQGSQLIKSALDKMQRSRVQSQQSNGMIQSNIGKVKSSERTDINNYFSPKNQNNSPTLVDYTAKIRAVQLQKDLKSTQKRYQQCFAQLKSTLAKKDMLQRQLKDSQGQVKLYKQKLEDLQETAANAQKRNDYKENSYKDQIKTLTDKLAAAQNQKQSMIFQKNDLVTEFEERQKTLRANFKQKEKLLNEDKNKLSKKVQQLGKDLVRVESKFVEGEAKVLETTQQVYNLMKRNEFLDQTCRQYEIQLQSLRQRLSTQKNKREQLEENKGESMMLQEQKKKLRKKMVEQQQELTKKLNSYLQLQSNYERLLKKTEQTQSSLKQKTTLIKSLQSDQDTLNQEFQLVKRQLQSKSHQLQQASSSFQAQKNRAQSLNEQIRQLQKKFSEDARLLKREIQQKQIRIQSLLRQNQDNSQMVHDYNCKVQHLQEQLLVLSNKINALTISNQELAHSKAELDGQIIQLQTNLSQERAGKQFVEHSLRQQINHKENTIKELQTTIKQLEQALTGREEESSYLLSSLTQKNNLLEEQLKKNTNHLQALKNTIFQLQQAKTTAQASIQQLQYSLKLKSNEIAFLKESLQRNFTQVNQGFTKNRQLQQTITKITHQNQESKLKIQELQNTLNQAKKNASSAQSCLSVYVNNSNCKLRLFLNAICKQQQINFIAEYEQTQIQSLMRSSISGINQIRKRYEQSIKQLSSDLLAQKGERHEVLSKLQSVLKQNALLKVQVEQLTIRIAETAKFYQSSYKQLQAKIENLNKQINNLQHQNASLKEFNSTLSSQLSALNEGLGSQSEQNSSLKVKIDELEDTIRVRQQQFSMSQSRQSSKFQEQTSTFKSLITQLQSKADKQSLKMNELTNQLNQTTKSYKQLQRSSLQQSKKLSSQIEKLNSQISKQAKQIQAKTTVNSRYNQIEAELKSKLQQTNKEILSLKQLNQNIRKRNQKAAQKQQQQESTISNLKANLAQLSTKNNDIEKAIKQKTAEFVSSREKNFQLQKQKQKLMQQLQISSALVKVKQEAQGKNQISIKALQEKIKALQLASSQASKKKEKSISSLESTKDQLSKQLQEIKIKLQSKQRQYKLSQQSSKQLNQEIKQVLSKNKELQNRIVATHQNLEEQQNLNAIQNEYLKPVRENLQSLKGHMSQYSRVADQFQSNKNKLIKLTTTRTQLPNQKYIHDRIKDCSLAYNKLKLFILGCNLSAQVKEQAGEQIKKVQVALDRVLRGEK